MQNTELKEKELANLVSQMMKVLNIKTDESNEGTPNRVAKMLNRELFGNLGKPLTELDNQMKTFTSMQTTDAPVQIKNIKFNSTCEHHWLPFTGYADIEYIPGEVILGLSKFPRVVKWFSKMPQIQERLTQDIGEYLVKILKPEYLKVVLHDVHHSCVSARGIEADCSTDSEYEYYGYFSN